MMICVLISPKNVTYRRCVYIVYNCYCFACLICFIAAFIAVWFIDEVLTANDGYESPDELRTAFVIFLILWACIFIPITLAGIQITHYGWKEQEFKA